MNCPACKEVPLNITERQGIEIDYCPQCRGVWLDRGELDKLIDRSQQEMLGAIPPGAAPSREPLAPPQQQPPQYQPPRYEQPRYDQRRGRDDDDYDDDDDDYRRSGKRRKKGGWLGDLLDFD